MPPKHRRRIAIAASSFLAAAALGIGGVYMFSGGSGGDEATVAPAKQTIEPMQVELPPAPPVPPATPPAPPEVKADGSAGSATITEVRPIKVVRPPVPVLRPKGPPKVQTPPPKKDPKKQLEPLPPTDDVYGKRQ